MSRQRILVTGGGGQMGREFESLSKETDRYDFLVLGREQLDITDSKQISLVFTEVNPHFCINCAAYTAVDRAEKESEEAFAVNKTGPALLARQCKSKEVPLIHFSTDYVYHSVVDRPIIETDPPRPKGVYARSKKEGEDQILEIGCPHLILRVSWLYSSFGHNFVKTMIRLGGERQEIQVVADQYGSPTYARDLAEAVMEMLPHTSSRPGVLGHIYNYSNDGVTNWSEFAKTIFSMASVDCTIHDTTTKNYNAPAQRPLWSVLSKEKVVRTFGLTISPWKKSLSECLDLLIRKN